MKDIMQVSDINGSKKIKYIEIPDKTKNSKTKIEIELIK